MPELNSCCVPSDWLEPGSSWRTWVGGWKTVNIAVQTWSPSSQNHRKGVKRNPTSSSSDIQEDKQNSLNSFRLAAGFFIFFLLCYSLFFSLFHLPSSKTIRHGVTKGPEIDSKGENKANHKNWETETNVTLLSHRAGILLFMCIIIIFTIFLLLFYYYFLLLFLTFSLPHFISQFNCIVWLIFFILYCVLIFLLSLHPCSNNTHSWSNAFCSGYPNHIFLFILLLFQYYCKQLLFHTILHTGQQPSLILAHVTLLLTLLLLWITLFFLTLCLLSIIYSHYVSSTKLAQVLWFLNSAHNHPPSNKSLISLSSFIKSG